MTISLTPVTSLLDRIVERSPLTAPDGKSGSSLERVVMSDGRVLVMKRISPAWDWLMRATNDRGRLGILWTSGTLMRVPDPIEHGIVAVEAHGDAWVVFMRDVSAALFPDDLVLSRTQSRRILQAAGALYDEFWGDHVDGLCTIADLYGMLSPKTAERERDGQHPIPKMIGRGWELFEEVVEPDVAQAVDAILEDPGLLARQLEASETTLIHGDLKFGNLGLTEDRVVMLDWDRMGVGPPAVDFAWYLAINASRIAASREEVIDDFRVVCGERYDHRALRLALLGGLVQLGWCKAFDSTQSPDEAVRAREAADLSWWVGRAREALETWSPT